MNAVSSRNAALIIGAILAIAAIAVSFLKGESCTVYTAWSAVMTPDKQAAIDEYVKKCRPRWSSHTTKEKAYCVVVLRPVTEPPPGGYHYKEDDVIFEVDKGPEPIQISHGSPLGWTVFEKLPEEERKNSLLIDCHFACPPAGIRKQLHSWHGHPIHYTITETPSSPMVAQ
jgi:hypothetical protein